MIKLNEMQKRIIDERLDKLNRSKFRSNFRLKTKEINYLKEKNLEEIFQHANLFIRKRLGPKIIENDGKQTPMRGHPVFVAQHATATCCRGCLEKWHHISKDKELSENEINFIVALIMEWIIKKYERS